MGSLEEEEPFLMVSEWKEGLELQDSRQKESLGQDPPPHPYRKERGLLDRMNEEEKEPDVK